MNADPSKRRKPRHEKRDPLPPDAQSERDAIVREIHEAFQDVTLRGGRSWMQCELLDLGSGPNVEPSLQSERTKHWRDLVEDRAWGPFPGVGGFSFIDAIGFRYYLPPTMIRFLRGDVSHWFPEHFPNVLHGFSPQSSADEFGAFGFGPNEFWTSAQMRCIARFVSFMSRHDPSGWEDSEGMAAWGELFDKVWKQHLND